MEDLKNRMGNLEWKYNHNKQKTQQIDSTVKWKGY